MNILKHKLKFKEYAELTSQGTIYESVFCVTEYIVIQIVIRITIIFI